MSWLKKLTSGLSKTSARVTSSLASLLGRPSIDAASLEDLEDALISADLGTAAAARLAERVKAHRFEGEVTAEALAGALSDGIADILAPVAVPLKPETGNGPHVVLLVGVNGSGKTTTAGKLAQHWRQQGMSVMLAAGDTFARGDRTASDLGRAHGNRSDSRIRAVMRRRLPIRRLRPRGRRAPMC